MEKEQAKWVNKWVQADVSCKPYEVSPVSYGYLLENAVFPDDSNTKRMDQKDFENCLSSGLFSKLPCPYKFNKINYGETKMDKEKIEAFKKEELFLVVCYGEIAMNTYIISKNRIPEYLEAGRRVFHIDALKEVTKAEVVVE